METARVDGVVPAEGVDGDWSLAASGAVMFTRAARPGRDALRRRTLSDDDPVAAVGAVDDDGVGLAVAAAAPASRRGRG